MRDTPADHVLIVDDEPVLSSVLARRLRARGFVVTTANSGPEALVLIDEEPFDLIMLDVMMPGMTGPEVLGRIRERWTKADLPVLMLTSRSDSDTIVQALENGANDFLQKPCSLPVLIARVRAHIEARRATEAMRRSEERYALAAQGSRDVLWDWSPPDDRVYLAPGCEGFIPVPDGEAFEGPMSIPLSRVHPEDLQRTKDRVQAVILGETDAIYTELRMRSTDDKEWIWLLLQGAAVRDPDGQVARMAGSISDRSEIGLHDNSTGLPNRRLFLDLLEEEVARGQGAGWLPTVLVMSLARVDRVASTLGPDGTEALLSLAAQRLLRAIASVETLGLDPQVTTLCRVSDHQFAVSLTGAHSPEEATRVAAAFREVLVEPYRIRGLDIRCGATVGLAPAERVGKVQDALAHASTAAVLARTLPEGLAVFSAEAHREEIDRMALEADLAVALVEGGLHLVYQPIVDLRTGWPCAVETLCRWNHPTRGFVRPDVFVAIAEGAGLASALGEWVLEQACRDAAAWQAPDRTPIRVSVNISPHQFEDPAFVPAVRDTLARTGLDPRRLELELTERVFAQDTARIQATLQELRDLGVRTSLDDFGTGYSSLSYLVAFRFDVLKIDRSFVSGLPQDTAAGAITRAALAMAHELELEVVAEGIEEEPQAGFLQSIGCDMGQGWLYSRPQVAAHWDAELVETRFVPSVSPRPLGRVGGK